MHFQLTFLTIEYTYACRTWPIICNRLCLSLNESSWSPSALPSPLPPPPPPSYHHLNRHHHLTYNHHHHHQPWLQIHNHLFVAFSWLTIFFDGWGIGEVLYLFLYNSWWCFIISNLVVLDYKMPNGHIWLTILSPFVSQPFSHQMRPLSLVSFTVPIS